MALASIVLLEILEYFQLPVFWHGLDALRTKDKKNYMENTQARK